MTRLWNFASQGIFHNRSATLKSEQELRPSDLIPRELVIREKEMGNVRG